MIFIKLQNVLLSSGPLVINVLRKRENTSCMKIEFVPFFLSTFSFFSFLFFMNFLIHISFFFSFLFFSFFFFLFFSFFFSFSFSFFCIKIYQS